MIYIIGEAPVPKAAEPSQWLHPDHCASGRRLLTYSGWTRDEYLSKTVRGNLYGTVCPRWSSPGAQKRAEDCAKSIPLGALVLLLGRRVSKAFGYPDLGHLEWELPAAGNLEGRFVALVPHSSGRNRYWNDPSRRLFARAFLRELMDGELG